MDSKDQKKTIWVTGAAGFIGSRFVESCNQAKIPVVSVDRVSLFDTRSELQGIEFGKVVDLEEFFEWIDSPEGQLESQRCRSIVHMGAITDTQCEDQAELDRLNVEYSKMIWLIAEKLQVPLVYASSAATYGDGSAGYQDDESDLSSLRPLNLYGQSKLTFDLWACAQKSAPPSWCGLRFFNVYGYGERHKEFMASVVYHAFDQIRDQGAVRLFKSHKDGIEDGHQKRDFIWVQDVIKVIHFVLEQEKVRGIYNLGTGQARTFLDLAKGVFQSLGIPEKINFVDTPERLRSKYQYFTQAPMRKLRSLGYEAPFARLEDGIADTIERLRR